jgi:regulation of enolase protein 1 (concanavalin A-like superfamily)
VVLGVAFSPDGTRLVTSGWTAKVWDARTGTPLLDLGKSAGESVQHIAFSPDGTRLATGGGGGTVTIWDARNRHKLMDGLLPPEERDYRLFWTRPLPEFHREEYFKALRAKDSFAARFHLDRAEPDAQFHVNLGVLLRENDDLDGAIAEYRAAIGLDPKLIGAHKKSALALADKDDCDGASAVFRQILALDPKDADVANDLGGQGQLAERNRRDFMVRLLTASTMPVLKVTETYGRPYFAARLFAAAFDGDPKLADDLDAQHRYNAACYAVLAAGGQDKDAKKLDDKERTHWRQQALNWLHAELAAYGKQLQNGHPETRLSLRQRLEHWHQDAALDGIRNPAALAKLPAPERQACQQLWDDLAHFAARLFTKANAGAWGTFEDPDEDCAFKVENGVLALTVPGSDHDLSSERGKMNAPRVLRPVEGDFTVEVKVAGKFEPRRQGVITRAAYQGAGFLIRQDDNNYLRLDRACLWNGRDHIAYANFELRVGGALERFGSATVFTKLDNDKETWLKIERRGNEFKAYATQEAGKWQALGTKTLAAPGRIEVGVAAINGAREQFTPRYSDFELKKAGPAN